jgi:hypothetical protein
MDPQIAADWLGFAGVIVSALPSAVDWSRPVGQAVRKGGTNSPESGGKVIRMPT